MRMNRIEPPGVVLIALLLIAVACIGVAGTPANPEGELFVDGAPCGSKKNSECRQAAALEGILAKLEGHAECPEPEPCPPGEDCPPCPPQFPCPEPPACDSCCPPCPPPTDDGPLTAAEEEAIAELFVCNAVAIRRETGGWSVDWRDQANNGFNQNRVAGCKAPTPSGLYPTMIESIEAWWECPVAEQTRRGC